MAEGRVLPRGFLPKGCRQPRSRLPTLPHARPCSGLPLLQNRKDVQISLNAAGTKAYSPANGNMDESDENHRMFDRLGLSIKSEKMELDHSSDCKSDDQSGSLPCTSQHGEPNSNWMAPGRVVWAKTSDEKWWPAEECSDSFLVLEERESQSSGSDYQERESQSSGSDYPVCGCVLIQYYETKRNDLVDPSTSLSPFDHCFEERCCDPEETFQSALKHVNQPAIHKALQRTEGLKLLYNRAESRKTSENWIGSSSSRTGDDDCEVGRGKRKRKPKVHFDEINHSTKTTKKDCRLKIVRFLGLTAPIGSPFSRTSCRRDSTSQL